MNSDATAIAEVTPTEPQVAMGEVVGFVRQLSHDLRNHLNAAELQSAYLNEIAGDPELKDELKRLRAMLSEMGDSLQTLTGALAPVRLTEMPYEAAAFMEDLQSKIIRQNPERADAIDWRMDVGAALLEIDPQILQLALLELFANAFLHNRADGKINATAEVIDERFIFTLREPKSGFTESMEDWGRRPFGKVKHGHYGLGLPRARSIVEAHRGQLQARYDLDSSTLVTTVSLPVSSAI